MAKRPYDKKRKDVVYAIEMGWTYCGISGGGHLQFRHPGTSTRLILPSSRSDRWGENFAMRDIRNLTPPKG